MSIDGLDECVVGYRVKILDSLNQILLKSPRTRVFVIGRPRVEAGVRRGLFGRATAMRIAPQRHYIISYLHSRLGEDGTPDTTDSSLKAVILKKVSEDISETGTRNDPRKAG